MTAKMLKSSSANTAAHNVNLSVFPDGLKTSGQHPPVYSQLRPYSAFPKIQSGPTVWKAEDYCENRERWTHQFTDEEIEELEIVTDEFIKKDLPLTGISQSTFPLPQLSKRFQALRKDLLDGKGFYLFKGLPVRQWDLRKCPTAYMGLGTYIGYFTNQNRRGHVLGHVKDLGEDPTKADRVRIYRTKARTSILMALTSLAFSALPKHSLAVNLILSLTHHIFNNLQEKHPDVVETLTEPKWYFGRKGKTSDRQNT
ncbi:hypothetical protein POX_f08350 [Penicillium oxalicum]|uniref:hypothetical protein n=1 Tax=Penicillium oxalicum TaxID=69781 RepID=UPI0020B72F00|nr:hypothetical protein POX_f08350 [Penicillium oxalicum]KAI2787968.1 hypothetical protein POX_f08350 [Penicillium oxalicum]